MERLEGDKCFDKSLKNSFMVLRIMHLNSWKNNLEVLHFYSAIIFNMTDVGTG